MEKYLYSRIKEGKLNYDEVIAKYPQYKAEIDSRLNPPIQETPAE